MASRKACEELQSRVIKEDLCTYCGACTGMCPYLVPYRGNIVSRDTCSLDRGRCREFCPRVELDMESLHASMFGSSYTNDDIGLVKEIFIARAVDREIVSAGQYGAVVTALGYMALEDGMIDSVVATDSADKFMPFGRVASKAAQMLACAGSSYVSSATLEAFNRCVREDNVRKVAVVCTPCQALALARMRYSEMAGQNNMDKLEFVIGLFCTWALSCEGFIAYLRGKVVVDDVVRVDIPPPPANTFVLYFKNSPPVSLPLSEVRPFIRDACTYCIDMTAEFTDISVGAAEGIEGWNTVIVRSEKGSRLIEKAVDRGVITTRIMPEHSMMHLKEASLSKKKRNLKNICSRTGKNDDLLYLKNVPPALKKLLETEPGEVTNGHR